MDKLFTFKSFDRQPNIVKRPSAWFAPPRHPARRHNLGAMSIKDSTLYKDRWGGFINLSKVRQIS